MRALLLMAAIGAAAPAGAQTVDVDFGRVVLTVSESLTAQIFHIVDQLSEWDAFAHRQYGRWARTGLTRDDEYRRLLRQHADLRRARGRGNGFEEAFLVEDSIAAAAERAVTSGLLSREEAAAERAILEHFAPLLAGMLTEQRGRLVAFRERLLADRTRLQPWIEKLARLAALTDTLRVPVFLIANPDPSGGGGGANGGRLVVEVPSPDDVSFLLHETLHVVLSAHANSIRAAAASAGVSFQTLNEAIAYAFAPGLTGDADRDLLAEALAGYKAKGVPATDPYVQYYTMATAIRPVLKQSLDDGDMLAVFMRTAVEQVRTIAPR